MKDINDAKIQILDILKENKDTLISGSDIATRCKITRSYVSKVVKEFIEIGYDIQIVERSGYIYKTDIKVLNDKYIKNKLDKEMTINILDKVDSTNNYLKRLSKDQSVDNILVVANMQTSGRGRLGRYFTSNNGSGIYMSMLIRPTFSLEYAKKLTCLVAAATSSAIDKLTGLDTKIKWVNDIYINNKKVCGILTEAVTQIEKGCLEYLVMGIGINMYHQEFSGGVEKVATTIEDESSKIYSRNELIVEVINRINGYLDNIEDDIYMSEYIDKSLVTGKKVELYIGGVIKEAFVNGITRDGELEVVIDDEIKKIASGEITRMVLKHE